MEEKSALINPGLNQRDKQMLQDVAHRLLAHGSLLRARGSEKQLYDWSIEHQEWVEEWAQLLGLKIIIQRDERLIMAIPEVPSMTRRLRRDETLVALALWYDYDVEVRENGAHEVFFSVKDFNESFQSKFPSIQALSASRLKEILRGFARFNLIETEWTDEFSDSIVQILPTLRFAIPFPDVEAWLKTASRFNIDEESTEEEEEPADLGAENEEDEEETSESAPENPEDQFASENPISDDEDDEDSISVESQSETEEEESPEEDTPEPSEEAETPEVDTDENKEEA